jgi:arginyl-tRNA synthetase
MNKNVINIIGKFLKSNNIKDISIIEMKVPKQKEFGDLTTNIAMKISKDLKKPPATIAKELVAILEKDKSIKKAEIKGPGFINIYLNEENKYDIINTIINQKDNYGRSDIGKGKRINLE